MKIFVFCGPAAFGKGGMEKVAINLSNYYANQNHIVHFGYFSREWQSYPAYNTDRKIHLIPWNRQCINIAGYREKVLQTKPDVFFIFGASFQFIELMALVLDTNIPVVIHEGSNPTRVVEQNWQNKRHVTKYEAYWEREAIFSQAQVIRFTMDWYKKSLPYFFEKKTISFPNAFENKVGKFATLNAYRIINIGGLKPNKNILPLLNAFQQLVQNKYHTWELHIFSTTYDTEIGQNYVRMVNKFVTDNNLENHVILHDETDTIDHEYVKSSIHVITSLSEGLGSCVAEAMCYGVPSIGIKNVPGVDGLIVNNVNGLLAEQHDIINSLYKKLSILMESKALRKKLSLQCIYDSARFSPSKIYNKWDEVLELVTKQNNITNYEIAMHYKRAVKKICANYLKKISSEETTLSVLRKNISSKNFLTLKERILIEKESNYE